VSSGKPPQGGETSALALQRALELLRLRQLPQAEALCREVLSRRPREFHALHLLGMIALQRSDPTAALRWLHAAIDANPQEPTAHSNAGAVLLELQRPQEALACAERALALDPQYAWALSNRGDALRALGRAAEALASYDRAIATAPQLAAAHFGRGNALADLASDEEALRSFDRAAQLMPRHPGVLCNRGNALLRLHRPLPALAAFDAALSLQPAHAAALNGRGCALRSVRRYAEAIESFGRALQSAPGWPPALLNLAKTWSEAGRADLAAQTYEALRAAAPDHPFVRGLAFHARLSVCDWSGYADARMQIVAGIDKGECADQPFSFLAVADSARLQLDCSPHAASGRLPITGAPPGPGAAGGCGSAMFPATSTITRCPSLQSACSRPTTASVSK
jgi:protein O-GlcNAc transferase